MLLWTVKDTRSKSVNFPLNVQIKLWIYICLFSRAFVLKHFSGHPECRFENISQKNFRSKSHNFSLNFRRKLYTKNVFPKKICRNFSSGHLKISLANTSQNLLHSKSEKKIKISETFTNFSCWKCSAGYAETFFANTSQTAELFSLKSSKKSETFSFSKEKCSRESSEIQLGACEFLSQIVLTEERVVISHPRVPVFFYSVLSFRAISDPSSTENIAALLRFLLDNEIEKFFNVHTSSSTVLRILPK